MKFLNRQRQTDTDIHRQTKTDTALLTTNYYYTSIKITLKDTSDFRDVIQMTLQQHQQEGILPPLDYANPLNYELRIHEGK